jgi:hypothetical protein
VPKLLLFALLWVYYYALPSQVFQRLLVLINPRKAMPALIPKKVLIKLLVTKIFPK